MKLIIAEKPDQGMTLSSIFKTKKNQGFVEILPNEVFPDGAYVTWAIGHVCQLVAPEQYNPSWKKWSLATLPILPTQYQYEVTRDKAKQFQVIKTLLANPNITEIIHAGDAGREGELIIRNILRLTKTKLPMKRLWISSLTPKAIKDGFLSLLDESDTRNLYYEAYTRACADWIVGMNASRLYSLLLQAKGFSDVFSVGRVQTPTLALIVKRELEIESFVAETFWEVQANFKVNGKKYSGKWIKDGQTRISSAEMAAKIATFCQQKHAEVSEIIAEKKEYQPPFFYNLSALQAEANRRFKFPPKKTLDVLQKLYQKGHVSYPRSDSRYITKGEAETFPTILDKLSKFEAYQSFFPLPIPSIVTNNRYVNEKKVTDHYAIIPTEQIPNLSKLSDEEGKLYDLIVRSVIAAHYEKAITEYTTVTTLVDGRAEFQSKGKMEVQEGFRKVIRPFEQDKEAALPLLTQGEKGTVEKATVKEGKTQPPKRYTEGQLITLMKTAGKHIEDKELEKVLTKTEGLGTEATRAGIITMLRDRNYIEIKKNIVYATAKARILIEAIGGEILASPEMTAKWEQRLKEISEGHAVPKQFMEQTEKMIRYLIESSIKQADAWAFTEKVAEEFTPSKRKGVKRVTKLGTCKKCNGSVIDKGTFYGCTNYQKTHCNFTLPKKLMGVNLTQKTIKSILENGKSEYLQGFKGKEKEFSATLSWSDAEARLVFLFADTVR